MVAIVVVLPRVDIPAAKLVPIYTIVFLLTNESTPVILCKVRAIGLLPGFILDICRSGVLGQWGKDSVLNISPSARERGVVQTPKCPELAKDGEGVVDEVLVRPNEVIIDYPVEVTFLGGKFDVDVVGTRLDNGRGRPVEVACCSV